MSNLKQIVQQLLDEGYVTPLGEAYSFTNKFYHELKREELQLVKTAPGQMTVRPRTKQEWEFFFMDFILEAKVPAKLEDNRGQVYYANKFSVSALKVFQKAIESGVRYEVLVKSTMLYYRSSVRYKKAIGNYFVHGDWKTDYENLASAAEQGEEQLRNHIKEETEDGTYTGYTMG